MSIGIGREFMQKTRYAYLGISDQQRGVGPPPSVGTQTEGRESIELPQPDRLGLDELDFLRLVTGRSSLRTYADTAITMPELSFLLWCTQGIKETHAGVATFRTVPSAGARHAFETVLLVNRVEALDPGLYGYAPLEHRLVVLDTGPGLADRAAEACHGQRFVKESALTFLWVAVPYRMTWRYVERGYRYLHLDAGHVCQNLYLAAEAIGGGACAVAAFDDEALADLLGLDGEESFVIYLAAVGKRPSLEC